MIPMIARISPAMAEFVRRGAADLTARLRSGSVGSEGLATGDGVSASPFGLVAGSAFRHGNDSPQRGQWIRAPGAAGFATGT
jgi:hypothetical protein